MELFAVNRVIDNTGNNIGIGLFDTSTNQVKLVPIDQVTQAIKKGAVKIENLEVVGGKLKGSNGDIDRLPTVTPQGQLIGDNKCTIIRAVSAGENTLGYDVVFFDGSCRQMSPTEIAFCGVTNGRIINNNGNMVISSIKGSYKVRTIAPVNKAPNEGVLKAEAEHKLKTNSKSMIFRHGFTKSNLKEMREILNRAFKEIKDTYDIDLSIGSISFEPRRFTARMEANIVTAGKTKEQMQFEKVANNLGLEISDFGRHFKFERDTFKIIGAKLKANKYPIIGEDIHTGKTFVFATNVVKSGLI